MGIQIPNTDIVDTIRYRITSRDIDGFKADEKIVGDFAFLFIRTKTDGSSNLNRERQSHYSLDIRAKIVLTDGQVLNTFTTVDIQVLDVNDAPPLFMELSYKFQVPDNTPLFAEVGRVAATDADEGINAEIYYSFADVLSEFTIHPTSGVVYLASQLPKIDTYRTYVVADNRGRGRQTRVPIEFNVIRKNQYAPEFVVKSRPPLSAYTPAGLTVLIFKVSNLSRFILCIYVDIKVLFG